MGRVTIESCLPHVDNRFQLVLVAAKRARALQAGATSLIDGVPEKPTVAALREIAAGKVSPAILLEADARVTPPSMRPLLARPEDEEAEDAD